MIENIRTENEWLRWGDKHTDFIGFFAPIEEARQDGDMIFVKCKYGEYLADPGTQEVKTIIGIDYYTLDEVARYGAGYKYWEV